MSNRHYHDLSVLPLAVRELPKQLRALTSPGVDTFRLQYLEKELLRKYVDPGEVDASKLDKPAFELLASLEKHNERINEAGFKPLPQLKRILFRARKVISDILGEWTYDVYDLSRFSGGASTSRTKPQGAPYYKFSCRRDHPLDVTPDAYSRVVAVFNATYTWSQASPVVLKHRPGTFRVVASNEVSTVPKNAEINRTIAKEPDGNMMLQLAIGAAIRERLALHGLDLDRSWRINQKLAREGSVTGAYATVDLESASASINQRIVWELIPPDWFAELDITRSKLGRWPSGEVHRWQQFSSMGNGFTFELETLIFLGLTVAVMEECGIHPRIGKNVVVFGDDIIVPVTAFPRLREVFDAVGFKTNNKKTFSRGPFRESCGGYFFKGHCVKPFRIKEPVDTVPRVIWLLNTIRKWSAHRMCDIKASSLDVCDPRLHEMYKGIYRRYRKHFSGVTTEYLRGRPRKRPFELRFGHDLSSSFQVAMPGGTPRHRIEFQVMRKRVSNHAAYCCRMQASHMERVELLDPRSAQASVPLPVSFIEPDYKGLRVTTSGVYLTTTVTHSGAYTVDRSAPWSAPVPLFPKEITG